MKYIFFLILKRAMIENYYLEDFKLKDIIEYKNDGPIINIIDKSYKPKLGVIENLELLRAETSADQINGINKQNPLIRLKILQDLKLLQY